MKYTEELTWILDWFDGFGRRIVGDDRHYRENIDFVHSLGLKCDCVGWCTIRLDEPGADQILDRIEAHCRENHLKARGYYRRKYTDIKSDWFELVPADFKGGLEYDKAIETEADDGSRIQIYGIRAYHETTAVPKEQRAWYVPERFRNACIRREIPGLDFSWIPDHGKYAAEQYFEIYTEQTVPRVGTDAGLHRTDTRRIRALGGCLPRIAGMFYELDIHLQDCYLAADMPSGGIAHAYSRDRAFLSGFKCNNMLVHRDTAELLLQEKALPASALRPACITDELPGGYVFSETHRFKRPTRAFMDEMLQRYEELKAKPRPERRVPEKEALQLLRRAKSERKEDFGKRMPKVQHAMLGSMDYAALAPYYMAANGGYLSDEYHFLPYADAADANAEFAAALQAEETWEDKPEGIVFAKCPDGDHVLLCKDGSIARISHEGPEILETWPTLSQFFFDAIQDGE